MTHLPPTAESRRAEHLEFFQLISPGRHGTLRSVQFLFHYADIFRCVASAAGERNVVIVLIFPCVEFYPGLQFKPSFCFALDIGWRATGTGFYTIIDDKRPDNWSCRI
jgi:hypothetical protein